MEKWETVLNLLFYRSDCPDVTQLRNYQHNLLDSEERQTIEAHSAVCMHCAAELADIAQFMQIEDVPAVTAQPALPALPVLPSLKERIKRTIVAVLQSPEVDEAQMAFRSGDTPQSLWYEADEIDINLEWRPDDSGRYRLFGQVFGLDEQAASDNQLTLQPAMVMLAVNPIEATISEDGAFAVDEINAGTYQVTIRHGDEQVIIPAVTISQLAE